MYIHIYIFFFFPSLKYLKINLIKTSESELSSNRYKKKADKPWWMNEDKDDDEKIKTSNSFTKPKSFLKSSNPKQQNQTSPTKLAATLESEEFENDLKENNNQNRTNRDSLSNKYSDDFDDENNKDNNLPKLSLDNNSTNYWKKFDVIGSDTTDYFSNLSAVNYRLFFSTDFSYCHIGFFF